MKYFLSRTANRSIFHKDIISHHFSNTLVIRFVFESGNVLTDRNRHLNNRAHLISMLVAIIAI